MRYKSQSMWNAVKVAVIFMNFLALGSQAREVQGELVGPRLVRAKSGQKVLEYICTAAASEEEARTVKLWLKPRNRSIRLFLGGGVTVDGTASRTRIPAQDKVFYVFPHSLESYKFKLTFSTNGLGNEAELRLVSGEDSIVCQLSSPNLLGD